MNDHDIDSLLDKYLKGKSSLIEEEALLQSPATSDDALATWAKYVNYKKESTPDDLNDVLWQESPLNRSKKKGYIIAVMSVAASFLLMTLLLTGYHKSGQEEYETKKRILEEALAMTAYSSGSSPSREIIYEDELVVIYTSSE